MLPFGYPSIPGGYPVVRPPYIPLPIYSSDSRPAPEAEAPKEDSQPATHVETPKEERRMEAAEMEKMQHVADQLREAADEIEKGLAKNSEPDIPQDILKDFTWQILKSDDDDDEDVDDGEDMGWWMFKGKPQSERAITWINDVHRFREQTDLGRRKKKTKRWSEWVKKLPNLGNNKVTICGDSDCCHLGLRPTYLKLEKVVRLIQENPNLKFENVEVFKKSLDQRIAQLTDFKEVGCRLADA
jgi:hypothetical protein